MITLSCIFQTQLHINLSGKQNIQNTIKQLLDWMTETEIADAVGTTQATINRIKLGVINEPKYSVGVKLVELHRRVSRRKTKRRAA